MRHPLSRTVRGAGPAAALLLLAACTVRAPLAPLPAPDVDDLAFASTTGAGTGAWPARDWWTAFGDPQLDRLVATALRDNPDMDAARARVAAADARAAAARAPLVPGIDATVGVQRSRLSETGLFPPPLGGSSLWQNRAALDARWELDLWGRHRSAVTGALHETAAARLDRDIAELTLGTAVARRYVEWHRIESRLAIGRERLRLREALLELARKRVDAGLDSSQPLRAAEAALPDARADVSALEALASVARIELAALTGAGPDSGLALTPPALDAPAFTGSPTLLPAELLARRPDVEAWRLRALAAAARADVAQADFYPNVNLAAALGLDSTSFDDWANGGSRFYNAGPALSLPLFGGGRRQAALDLATAQYDETVAGYRQSLVGAVRDVAALLVELRSLAAEERDADAAVAAQEQAFELARRRYAGGLGTYTDVLVAEGTLLGQRLRTADLAARRLDATVRLIAALGGGLPAQPPQTP